MSMAEGYTIANLTYFQIVKIVKNHNIINTSLLGRVALCVVIPETVYINISGNTDHESSWDMTSSLISDIWFYPLRFWCLWQNVTPSQISLIFK